MSAGDPRYPDDGLAELVDALEQRLEHEAWRPRYILGWDGALDERTVLAELTADRLFLLPEPPRVEFLDEPSWLRLEDLERDLAASPLDRFRRAFLNHLAPPTQETHQP